MSEKQQTKLAFIPARAGSKRLKNKNIFPLAGKPLINYTIEAAINSRCFDTVIVSTDSNEIAEVASQFKEVTIYDRPAEFADSKTTVFETLLAMLADLEKHEIVGTLLPTCPFRSANDIQTGLSMLDAATDSVISICKYSEPPQLALIKEGDSIKPVSQELAVGKTNSQYMTEYYKPNGGFYFSTWDSFVEKRSFFKGNVKGYELPKERSVDIDTLLDIKYAEAVLTLVNE